MKKYLTPELLSEKLALADVMTASGDVYEPRQDVHDNVDQSLTSVFNWNS